MLPGRGNPPATESRRVVVVVQVLRTTQVAQSVVLMTQLRYINISFY